MINNPDISVGSAIEILIMLSIKSNPISDLIQIKYAGLPLPLSLFTRMVLPPLLKPLPLTASCKLGYASERRTLAPLGGQNTVMSFLNSESLLPAYWEGLSKRLK
jgi:hypothetical protein